MTETTGEVVDALFAAFAAEDADAIVALWEPGGVETNSMVEGELTAPDELRGFLAELFGALDGLVLDVRDRLVVDDKAAVRYTIRGRFSGGPLQGIQPNGRDLAIEAVDVLRVRDGRVVGNDVTVDGLAVARQLGAMPAAGSLPERVTFGLVNARSRLVSRFARRR